MKQAWFVEAMEGRPVKPPAPYSWAMSMIPTEYRETGDSYDWVPTEVLYRDYMQKWMDVPHRDYERALTISEYGLVVRLAFPGGEPCVRRMGERKLRGTTAVTGPGALRTPDEQFAYRRRRSYRNGRSNL